MNQHYPRAQAIALPHGGGEIVMQSMGVTAAIFVGLSAYALTTRKDFSFMSGDD